MFLCTCCRLYRSRHPSESLRTSSGMLGYAWRSVRALGVRFQPRGASLRCCDSAFEYTVQWRDRTFPEKDWSGPASLAIRDGRGMSEPSGLRGLCIGLISIGLLIL